MLRPPLIILRNIIKDYGKPYHLLTAHAQGGPGGADGLGGGGQARPHTQSILQYHIQGRSCTLYTVHNTQSITQSAIGLEMK